jgi:purine-nucleoside phosphorylase
MKSDVHNFKQIQEQRYREWLSLAQNWVFGEPHLDQKIGPYLILIHSSEGNPEKHLLPHLTNLRTYAGFVQGQGAAVGTYQDAEIWLLHHPMGCSAVQFWMECLVGTPVRYLIGLGEMTAYRAEVSIGDIVLPTTSIRGDLITECHADPQIPASCDYGLLEKMTARLVPSGWPVHIGPIYSGMPGGVGKHNPIMKEKIWRQMQSGVLGNAIETSVTYLEAMRFGIKAVDAWAVSDDIAYGYFTDLPGGRDRWEHAWSLIAQASLDVLAEIAAEERV